MPDAPQLRLRILALQTEVTFAGEIRQPYELAAGLRAVANSYLVEQQDVACVRPCVRCGAARCTAARGAARCGAVRGGGNLLNLVSGKQVAPVTPVFRFKHCGSDIDASHSRQPLVNGERLVRYEVNAVIVGLVRFMRVASNKGARVLLLGSQAPRDRREREKKGVGFKRDENLQNGPKLKVFKISKIFICGEKFFFDRNKSSTDQHRKQFQSTIIVKAQRKCRKALKVWTKASKILKN